MCSQFLLEISLSWIQFVWRDRSSPARTEPTPLARKVWRIPAGVVWGLQGNGKCWFILKLFASLCIQLQSGLDVYHYPGWLQELMTVTRFKIKRSGYSAATLLLLLVLMNKNLMSFKLHNGHLKMWRQSRALWLWIISIWRLWTRGKIELLLLFLLSDSSLVGGAKRQIRSGHERHR